MVDYDVFTGVGGSKTYVEMEFGRTLPKARVKHDKKSVLAAVVVARNDSFIYDTWIQTIGIRATE